VKTGDEFTFAACADEPVAVVADAGALSGVAALLARHTAALVVSQVADTRLRHLYNMSAIHTP